MVLGEKDRSIERLENDLRKADIDKEDLKATYNNYFLQVQTLINQKAIGSPSGSTKGEKPTQESKPEQKESTYTNVEEIKATPEDKNPWKEKDATIQKVCKQCGQPFLAKNPKKETCSAKCRTAFNRKK